MTSCICSEPIDVTKFGLIYAGAQKNIGIAGLTVVIVRNDLVGDARKDTPVMMDYSILSEHNSVYNTPPIYNIYITKLVLEWMLSVGGLEEMKRRNERKASLLYDYLDGQSYYTAPVDKKCRSMTNIVFVTGDGELDKKFAKEAEEQGMLNLLGHPSIGGLRASMNNAMPYEGVEKLVAFMKSFAKNNPRI
jgi:phosphoserine aminotransferase